MDNQLKRELMKIEIPDELHERSKRGIKEAKSEMGGRVSRFFKRRLAIAILAVSFMIPTGAFAYQTLLADDLYGSYENLKKHVTTATMEQYFLFDAKLSQAKGELGEEQYAQFKELLSVLTNAMLEYGDKNGNIDYSQVPAEQLKKLKITLSEIQPFFDQLNGLPSSKELLTSEEYDQYIEAIITYVTVLAQLGVSSPPEIEQIPDHLQKEYLEAQKMITDVNERQLEH